MSDGSGSLPVGVGTPRSRWWILAAAAAVVALVVGIVVNTSDDKTTEDVTTTAAVSTPADGSTSAPDNSRSPGATDSSSEVTAASDTSPTGPATGGSSAPVTTSASPAEPTTTGPAATTTAPVTTVASGSATAVNLGVADLFAALGNTGVDSAGTSAIGGQIGASNGPVTGISSADNPAGVIVVDSRSAGAAQDDVTTAAERIDARTAIPLASSELGGETIRPGTYTGDSITIAGTLTLDSAGDQDAEFVFRVASLTVAEGSRVALQGTGSEGSPGCAVYWQVGTSATLGPGARFVGTVIAGDSITAGSGSEVLGRLLARGGAVHLDATTINLPACA